MKIDIKGIIEGAINNIVGGEQVKQVAKERMDICKDCEFYSETHRTESMIRPDEHCMKCKCNLPWKTSCLSCACPIGKWKRVTDKKTEDKLKQKL